MKVRRNKETVGKTNKEGEEGSRKPFDVMPSS